jgi:chorismate synthase
VARFEFLTAGESHGPSLTVIVTGMPAGVKLVRERIDSEMSRRQHGHGRGGRMQIEQDAVTITGGVRGGETLGSPIAVTIPNRDHESWRAAMDPWTVDETEAEKRRLRSPRPGHADLAGGIKYDRRDLRDVLERASARETAARVAAGALAKELLAAFGIEVRSGVLAVGATGDPWRPVSWADVEAVADSSPLRAIDRAAEQQMIEAVDAAKTAGETLGGVVAVVAKGLPIGLGSYVQWSEKLDGRIAQAVMSVHAVKGVAIGDGITASMQLGSQSHDAIEIDGSRFVRPTNRAGGLEGGVTNGEDLVVRAFMKPIATLRKGLPSVDLDARQPARSQWERSDVTAVPACGIVCEAMLAITIADAMREKFGGDSLGEMKRSYEAWLEQVALW